MDPRFTFNQMIDLRDGKLALSSCAAAPPGTETGERLRHERDPSYPARRRQRAAPGRAASDVPFADGQTVLDGLRHIRAHSDPTLAFRYSCINANACKECMMLIDGAVRICLHHAASRGRDAASAASEKEADQRSRHRDRAARRAPQAAGKVSVGRGEQSTPKPVSTLRRSGSPQRTEL